MSGMALMGDCRLGRSRRLGCFSPEQQGGNHEKDAKELREANGWHGHGNQAADVAAEQHSDGAKNAGAEVHVAFFAVFQKGANPYGGKQNKKRRTLGGVLIQVKQMNHCGGEDHSASDAKQANENSRAKTDQ